MPRRLTRPGSSRTGVAAPLFILPRLDKHVCQQVGVPVADVGQSTEAVRPGRPFGAFPYCRLCPGATSSRSPRLASNSVAVPFERPSQSGSRRQACGQAASSRARR